MTYLWLLPLLPELAGLAIMAALITYDCWIGGRNWKP